MDMGGIMHWCGLTTSRLGCVWCVNTDGEGVGGGVGSVAA